MDPYVLAVTVYGLLGLALGVLYYGNPRLRIHPWVHFATVAVISLAALLTLSMARIGGGLGLLRRVSVEGFLFLGASVCHVPVIVYLLLSQWSRIVERITSPSHADVPREKALSKRRRWRLVQQHLESLSRNPLDFRRREQLAEVYLNLDLLDSAILEYRKAIECMDRGYAQARLMFKVSRLWVDRKKDIAAAMPLLRRLVRLYPKSYFASYARRVVNHYEARQE